MKKLAVRALGIAMLGASALALAFFGYAASLPLPAELRDPSRGSSLRILDRNGRLLRDVRASDGTIAEPISPAAISPTVRKAMLAAEDARFDRHFGIDPVAIARAAFQAALHRTIVSGASTITQQLARTLVARPRTIAGKIREMALAVRIEASLSKDEILAAYLSRVAFGPNVRGIDAASRSVLGKSPRELSIAEAALLASLPRGPSLYDPHRGTERVRRRRDRVIARLVEGGMIGKDEASRAIAEPIALGTIRPVASAPHFVHAIAEGKLGAPKGASIVETTIDAELQREAEGIVQQQMFELRDRHATAAAVIVLENETGDILAYVGSPDAYDVANLGGNDGVLAKRQPGSALKPFVYELGIEELGWTAATRLPDVELRLPANGGEFVPANYDGRYHGPVLLREALANSFNVPAVWAASVLGPARVLDRLRAVGLTTLDASAETYGAAIALGDGEVRLVDLANAYASLARGGAFLPVRGARAFTAGGERVAIDPAVPRHVLDERAVATIADVLSDDRARLASFGEHSALDPGFPVAAKTGTSKGFRDNVAVGFTHDVTVAVWVGNFDGSPMHDVSGITGAGPIFRDVMKAAMRGRDVSKPVSAAIAETEEVDVCPLSGLLPGHDCPHVKRERFVKGTAPRASCAMHRRVRIDIRNGLLAGPACERNVDERTFESYPPELLSWARAAGRPLAPDAGSPLCPPSRERRDDVRILSPLDGARFVHDPSSSSREAITVRIEAPAASRLRVDVDGVERTVTRPFDVLVAATPGIHHVAIRDGDAEDHVTFEVE